MKCLKFDNNSIPMVARLIEDGDVYGFNNEIIYDKKEPMIEFFDRRYPHVKVDNDINAQFISRYNISTFNDIRTGLYLDSSSVDWSITKDNVSKIQSWIQELLSKKPVLDSSPFKRYRA